MGVRAAKRAGTKSAAKAEKKACDIVSASGREKDATQMRDPYSKDVN